MVVFTLSAWRANPCHRRGSISVELALLALFVLLPLLAAVWDFGLALKTQAQLDNALAAAIQFAWSSPSNAVNARSISLAAQAAYGSGPSLTVANPVISYGCVQPGVAGSLAYAVTPEVNSSVTCPAATSSAPAQTLATFITVSLSASVAFPVPLPVLGDSISLSVTGTARTQ